MSYSELHTDEAEYQHGPCLATQPVQEDHLLWLEEEGSFHAGPGAARADAVIVLIFAFRFKVV